MQATAQFAYALVALAVERAIEQAVHQIGGTVQQVEKSAHAYEGIDLLTVHHPEYLDFEVSVDFTRAVVQFFHFSVIFLVSKKCLFRKHAAKF